MAFKGIDIPIENVRTQFETNLFSGADFGFYGRIQRVEDYKSRPVPCRYIESTREYKDVLLDDHVDGLCFFDVLPRRSINIAYSAHVWICFAVNLEALFPSVGIRATEHVHESVKNILLNSPFTPTDLITDLAAFREYDLVQSTDNLQPYYLFRFNTEIIYQDNC